MPLQLHLRAPPREREYSLASNRLTSSVVQGTPEII
jgi:hypothetical protein